MAVRRPEGAALLVAGHGTPNVAAFDASAVHTLGQIGEALLATGTPWHIRRLTALAGDRYAADRRMIKRSLGELVVDRVRVAMVVLLGQIVEVAGELALVTGEEAREYPEDSTLPLAYIRDRLSAANAEQLVVAVSARGDGGPLRWLAALGTEHPQHVIAVDAPEHGNPMIDALLDGLCGAAVDPRTGTVTLASLSEHLAGHAQTVQPSTSSETVAQPPPLAGLWDVRRSQLSARRNRTAPRGDADDLAGSVLPGRFRIDRVVARGTFGTVYRARQLAVERDVAVKVLHGEIDPGSEDGRLFVHEIRSVGRIDHPNVVRIYQADITLDGRLFFAMELLAGRDLETLGREDGKLPRCRAVALVCQLLAGLGAAHDAGLVHADIKPANAIVVARKHGDGEDHEERVVLVDFGLARLRAPDRPAESAGGTPAYMAPEHFNEGRVDARSDLFSAALVLVWLMTGWRRPNALTLIPPVDELIDDADLRAVLARALDVDPGRRYGTARELAAALAGSAPPAQPEVAPPLPFRHLAPLTEDDRDRLHGRESDLALITEHALYRRAVIYTAPSGTGKTSVLCAGVMPRLEALGIHAVYHRCRADSLASLVAAIDPEVAARGPANARAALGEAIASFHEHRGGKLVIVADQLEAALGDRELVSALLGFEHWPRGADVSVVLSVREDYLARLLARTQELEPNIPVVRLPPLSPEGARTAIVAPLAEARLAIEPELLDSLLVDLQRAAAAIGPEMGWGDAAAVFPPHLQLACSVLYEALAPGETTLALRHYRALGGFDAIVGEHLDRVIETELEDGLDLVARDLFVALVTSANERAIRPESELLAITSVRHTGAKVAAVLETLRSRGLLVRVRGDGEPSWELVHDSLVPRVLAWIDRKDLARRRAIELVRHHLRRSTPDTPSLLTRRELRELRPHPGAIEELDAEWQQREPATTSGWTPSGLVARSRSVLRRRVATVAGVVGLALTVGGVGLYRWQLEEQRARAEASLRERDLGRFVLSLEPFDWDPVALVAKPVTPTPGMLRWSLHSADPKDIEQPGPAFDRSWVVRGTPRVEATAMVEAVEAHGGRAFLVIERAGCSQTIVPIQQLPGYTLREAVPPTLHVAVPTCAATLADTIEIPAGTFVFGGTGVPPSPLLLAYPSFAGTEEEIDLPAFRIDRTEVTNAAFGVFAAMASFTGIDPLAYPASPNAQGLSARRAPVTGIDWFEARAYCRFLGKQLPTSPQWMKALRGGLVLHDGSPNPMPRRNLPWGTTAEPNPSRIKQPGVAGVAEVGTQAGDISPYGVRDLAGNVMEWMRKGTEPGMRVVRGGNWDDTELEKAVDYNAIENPRPARQGSFTIGVRCAQRP